MIDEQKLLSYLEDFIKASKLNYEDTQDGYWSGREHAYRYVRDGVERGYFDE